MIGYSLETWVADQEVIQLQMWLWSKDSVNSAINQRLAEQAQEVDFKLEGSGGSTLVDTLSKKYLSSSDEQYFVLYQDCKNMMFVD